MFRDFINKPIDPIPSQYVERLTRPKNEFDYALTCLGIAMLRPRMEKYEGITGCFTTSYNTEEACLQDFFINDDEESLPSFNYYTFREEWSEAGIKDIVAENGYAIKENIGTLLKVKSNINCLAVYHKTKNRAAIFINSTDIRFYHMLISFISLLFPALFKDCPLEKRDTDIILALSKTDRNAFINAIQVSVQEYLPEFRRTMLLGLLTKMHEVKITSARQDVDNQRRYVKHAEEEYMGSMARLKELVVIYEGMKATETFDEPEEDLVEYLADNKQIHNLKIEENCIKFAVATLLNNYNENAWATFKDRGYIYDGDYTNDGRHTINLLDVFKQRKNRKLLLDNIFSESPEFAIKIAGNYTLNFESNWVTTNKNYNYAEADPIFKSYIPNPHLKFFGCLGGYERKIPELLANRNYIGTIELCCASAGSVDLDETEQTFRPFIGMLMSSREKVLRRRDGVEMTPEEALLYLIDKEKTNETDHNE